MLIIHSNGSKYGGESPDSIEVLIKVLKTTSLDPTFERYGNFIIANPCSGIQNKKRSWVDGLRLYPDKKVTQFSGNFFEVSHVFSIDTDERGVIRRLTKAIHANQASKAYKDARKAVRARKAA